MGSISIQNLAFGILKKAAAITNNALKPEKMTDDEKAESLLLGAIKNKKEDK